MNNFKFLKSVLFAALFLLLSCGNDYASNDLRDLKLKGKVLSVKQFTYEAISKFGEISRGEKKRYLDEPYTYFNDAGEITKIEYFDYNGNMEKKEVYTHNSNSLISEVSRYTKDGDLRGKRKLEYDSKNRLINVSTYDSNGELQSVAKNSFDSGRLPSQTDQYDDAGDLQYTVKMFYDNRSNLVKIEASDQEKSLGKMTFSYNDKNDAIEQIQYGEDGDIDNSETAKYTYDGNNNWIKKITYEEGKPKYVIERVIRYSN